MSSSTRLLSPAWTRAVTLLRPGKSRIVSVWVLDERLFSKSTCTSSASAVGPVRDTLNSPIGPTTRSSTAAIDTTGSAGASARVTVTVAEPIEAPRCDAVIVTVSASSSSWSTEAVSVAFAEDSPGCQRQRGGHPRVVGRGSRAGCGQRYRLRLREGGPVGDRHCQRRALPFGDRFRRRRHRERRRGGRPGLHSHRDGVLVVEARLVRHLQAERQGRVLGQPRRRREARRRRGGIGQRHVRAADLGPCIGQRVISVRVAAAAGQGHGCAVGDIRLVRARVRCRRLVAVRQRDGEILRVAPPAVTNLHRDLVAAIGVGVVRILEILRRDKGQCPASRDRELPAVRPAAGAGRNRPLQVHRRGVGVARRERRHRGLALKYRKRCRSSHQGRGRTRYACADSGRQRPVVQCADCPGRAAGASRRQRDHHVCVARPASP